jgi:hypothetical protein
MNNIKVINDFVEEQDRQVAIDIINELMLDADQDRNSPGYDGRFVFFRPEQPEAVEFVKKYAAKSIASYDYAPNAVLHDVNFIKSISGASLEVHMDFDNLDACTECPYASVMYLNKDYTGAKIFFPALKEEYSPEPGTVLLFPQDDRDYAHGVTKMRSGERYIINICYTNDVTRQFDLYK